MSTENQTNPEEILETTTEEATLPEVELDPVAALEEQVGQLKDQLLRNHAEMENVRRRAAEDVSKAHKFSIERFANELLPVQESLEKALADNTADVATLREGVGSYERGWVRAIEGVFQGVKRWRNARCRPTDRCCAHACC